jgi:hypothetical protein
MSYKTEQEGVMCLIDDKGELCGVIRKDMMTRKNIFYSCKEMSFEDLQALFKTDNKTANEQGQS